MMLYNDITVQNDYYNVEASKTNVLTVLKNQLVIIPSIVWWFPGFECETLQFLFDLGM